MTKYGASELIKNKRLQKKAVNYVLDKSKPFIENVGSQMLDSLSTKTRPDKKYKTDRKDLDGGAIDIHKMIGKIPKPKGGWTPTDYKYPETGEVLSWYVKPKHKVDEIAAYHDICYDRGINKNECDETMV